MARCHDHRGEGMDLQMVPESGGVHFKYPNFA